MKLLILTLCVAVAKAGILPTNTIECRLYSRSGAGDQVFEDPKSGEIYYTSSEGETFVLNWVPVDVKGPEDRNDDVNHQNDSHNPVDAQPVPGKANIEAVPEVEPIIGYYGGYWGL